MYEDLSTIFLDRLAFDYYERVDPAPTIGESWTAFLETVTLFRKLRAFQKQI